jgi:hypothetical protein
LISFVLVISRVPTVSRRAEANVNVTRKRYEFWRGYICPILVHAWKPYHFLSCPWSWLPLSANPSVEVNNWFHGLMLSRYGLDDIENVKPPTSTGNSNLPFQITECLRNVSDKRKTALGFQPYWRLNGTDE